MSFIYIFLSYLLIHFNLYPLLSCVHLTLSHIFTLFLYFSISLRIIIIVVLFLLCYYRVITQVCIWLFCKWRQCSFSWFLLIVTFWVKDAFPVFFSHVCFSSVMSVHLSSCFHFIVFSLIHFIYFLVGRQIWRLQRLHVY